MEQLRMIHLMDYIPAFTLADGFTLRRYLPGDEVVWTEICKFGLLAEDEGIECWDKYMLALENLVPERDVFFICDLTGCPKATFTAFIQADGTGLLHMVGSRPEVRGHRLGYSMTAYALNKLVSEFPSGKGMVRLKSDDWRLSAVKAYLQCGFHPVLFDVNMDTRWKAICDKLNLHGTQMLDDTGNATGICL